MSESSQYRACSPPDNGAASHAEERGSIVLTPFGRALAYYGAGGFALALLCAAVFLDPSATKEDDAHIHRLRRRALALAPLGIVHPVIAGTALLLARDAARAAGTINAGAAH